MMELTDSSSDERRDLSKPSDSTRSGIGIDLNEIPSPSSFSEAQPDSFDVVRSYHDNPPPPPGGPATVPGQVRGSVCGACGHPEVRGYVVVCDGCERGFHLGCAGMRGRQAVNLEDWVCGECMLSGVKSKRWRLGDKSKQLLDINASPPSEGDADGEGSAELLDSRKHIPGDNSFGGGPFGASMRYSNLCYTGNRFSFQKGSEIVTRTVKMGFEDILHHMQNIGKSFEEVDLGFPLEQCRSNKSIGIRLPSQNPNEVFLQALRDFISERHGVLEEGWRVEFKQPVGSCELYAVYCAPDGKTFDSVYEVACYLGLMSNYYSVEPKLRRERSFSFSRKSCPLKKRKIANGCAENKGSLINDHLKGLSPRATIARSNVNNIEAGPEENGGSVSQKCNEGLPLQFEDFFVLCLGEIDARPSYHDENLLYPVGYRSCWHDKVTGSLFISEVLDGGDSGPLFKVRRCSCSVLAVPIASTLLHRRITGKVDSETIEESGEITYSSDESLQMMLSDPCPPAEDDVFSCLRICSDAGCIGQLSNRSQQGASSLSGKRKKLSPGYMDLTDEIGEILVEDSSSALAWKRMSQDFMKIFSEIYNQKSFVRFCCNHVGNDMASSNNVTSIYKSKRDHVGNDMASSNHVTSIYKSKRDSRSLEKFCSSPSSASIPSPIHAENELEIFHDMLEKWLEQDRFGLDAEFVQEILEQVPDIQSCSRYRLLKERGDSSTFLTVENGLLEIKRRGDVDCKEEGDVLFRKSKKARLVGDCVIDDRPPPPPGKPLCLKVRPELVGDVYQVWDLLSRFHDILGLEKVLSLEELAQELINPWVDCSNISGKFESEHGDALGLKSHVKYSGGELLSPGLDSGENPHAFIHMETRAMKEAAEAKLASLTYSKCSGVALTKAHRSVLRVLISELQFKVAAFVDPSFDSGDSKAKRGRKKDVDSSIPAKRMKLNLLPLNELTWPELARRYILAALSMDCNLDSAEVTARESGKVFRCLQGDGGVLCGSLTGVAGMEADALLLAEAIKQIFGSLNRENNVITIEEEVSDATGSCESVPVNDGTVPEWAKVLEPVRKLPTNVGTRIRKCVYDALNRNPPEWAQKILERSISKEVYKGNASGPTKKAVLSLLANLSGENLQRKTEKGRKRKTVVSISDVVMKQCRIVLRHAAAADDAKVFCNLLGRKLMSSSDNDDEGLLGTPAMVSRPLDLRTIDLRLAAGSYGGSHEAFLEDVRELWNNVHSAYSDQPDLIELAETLSKNFESLYEKEVVGLVHKLHAYAKLECFNGEMRKEMDDFLASISEIPKAPWDEGVCKVCGVDKDDDSVLLCDTCDAEYHTYCLNPPLARIPEGNWYCPSCVCKRVDENASEYTRNQVTGRHRGKKYQAEVVRIYMEALANLATIMEEREYWEFTIDERLFLLKYLSDELLSSALIRQHLEHCAESTTELQQRLRPLSQEWKSLKSREEILAARLAKLDASTPIAVEEGGVQDESTTMLIIDNKCIGPDHVLTDGEKRLRFSSDDLQGGDGCEKSGLVGSDKHSSVTSLETNSQNVIGTEGQTEDIHATADKNDKAVSEKTDKHYKLNESPLTNSSPQEAEIPGTETFLQGNMESDISTLPSSNQKVHDTDIHAASHFPYLSCDESQVYHHEMNSLKKKILLVQDSIAAIELELLRLSVRGEFLGCDSVGRMYWTSVTSDGHSHVIVSGSVVGQYGVEVQKCSGQVKSQVFHDSASASKCDSLALEGSKVQCPFLFQPNSSLSSSPWVSYGADAEIKELISWLRDSDPKERELKESILHWQKQRSPTPQLSRSQVHDEQLTVFSTLANGEITECFSSFVTRAATLLEKKYGPCLELETPDILKKQVKRARLANDEKMFRCVCLEPLWPSRHHCLSCHISFSTEVELDGHNDGKCSSGPPVFEKSKETSDNLKGKDNVKSETTREESSEKDMVDTSKSWCSEHSSRLIKFQNDGIVCPYDFEAICSKFLTKDSNKDLIQEIGLIGSDGISSFVPSISYPSESTILSSQKEVSVLGDRSAADEILFSQGSIGLEDGGNQNISDSSTGWRGANEISEILKTKRSSVGCLEHKSRKLTLGGQLSETGSGRRCVVPQSSLRPLVGRVLQIVKRLKINLLDMDAALPEEALRQSKSRLEMRWAWRAFVKSAATIYEMVQATIVFEDMIRTEYLKKEWWYWSSLSAAARTSTVSSLSLRIYSLDAAIIYEKTLSGSNSTDNLETSSMSDQKLPPGLDSTERSKATRKSSKKRKEPEG